MIRLIYDPNHQSRLEFNLIQVNQANLLEQHLSILADGCVSVVELIECNQQILSMENIVNISRVLVDDGTLKLDNKINQFDTGIKEFILLLLSGANLNQSKTEENIFLKKNQEVKQLNQKAKHLYKNAYGVYDQNKETFLTTEKQNPFQQIKQEQQQTIDEDSLLNDNVQVKKVESCATQPKACKNCSCGRKEEEQKRDKDTLLQELKTGTIKGSCGSCYLGDAFRCANCPYRGLPSFKPGEKVVLETEAKEFLETEVQETQIQGGKVKIQL